MKARYKLAFLILWAIIMSWIIIVDNDRINQDERLSRIERKLGIQIQNSQTEVVKLNTELLLLKEKINRLSSMASSKSKSENKKWKRHGYYMRIAKPMEG